MELTEAIVVVVQHSGPWQPRSVRTCVPCGEHCSPGHYWGNCAYSAEAWSRKASELSQLSRGPAGSWVLSELLPGAQHGHLPPERLGRFAVSSCTGRAVPAPRVF